MNTVITTPVERFVHVLTDQYIQLFKTPEYRHSNSTTTPQQLAVKMTKGLIAGSAGKEGQGIKNTCKALGIKYTYKAIKQFLEDGTK